MKKIVCLYTGGTIGCQPGPDGLAPVPDGLAARTVQLASTIPCELVFRALPRLLDSACMGPGDWNEIAGFLLAEAAACEGFVVLHGTDTMAYTAAALSFLLEGLPVPVVLTGSQRPWSQANSDAGDNVVLALRAAVCGPAGVWLAFGGDVMPGRYVHKVDADADCAFMAPNREQAVPLPSAPGAFTPRRLAADKNILALRLYPGFSPGWLARALMQSPPDALLLECYGSGNLPDDALLQNALRMLSERGVPIVVCSQCLGGVVQLGHYQAGSFLAGLGVLSGGWLGAEACLAQLHLLLAECADGIELRAHWRQR